MADIRKEANQATSAFLEKPLNFIDGVRVAPSEPTHKFAVYEPSTGKELIQCPSSGKKDVDAAMQSSREAFKSWSQVSAMERSRILTKIGVTLRERAPEIAKVESVEQGKPLLEATAEVLSAAECMEFYAGLAVEAVTGKHVQLDGGSFGIIRREPLGVCVGIGPWNFPVALAVCKAAPALTCGNTMVYKPSPFTPITTVMVAELFTECGLPNGVFNVVQGEGQTGVQLTGHDEANKVSFTGSVATGKKVMASCAAGIKPVTLELGGKSPLIVFADADLDNALKATLVANFINQGEVCCNGTRVFIESSIKEEFVKRLVAKTKTVKVGDPLKADSKLGALITKEHREKVLNYVESAKKQGAKVLCGGEKVSPADGCSGGYFMSPCILDQVGDDMTVAKEEIFGPVMSIFSFTSEEEVIKRANNTNFGLAAGVFTSDVKKAHRVANQLQAGLIGVNNYNQIKFGLPFGGYKQSGIGRENAASTIDMFTQLKSVYVEMGDVMAMY